MSLNKLLCPSHLRLVLLWGLATGGLQAAALAASSVNGQSQVVIHRDGFENQQPVVVIINEIMQNPTAVLDGAGEWVELYNPGAGSVDINGWTIGNASASHPINNGGPLQIPAGGYLVLGNNADINTNGGVAVDYSYGGTIALSNAAGSVILRDAALSEVDRVDYDGGTAFPDPDGASMSLVDPALDNNIGANWCVATTPFGSGDLGTPGSANDCGGSPVQLLINEVDADTPGSDVAEFVEIYDGGAGNTALEGLSLVFYNGSNDQSYGAFDLDGYVTDNNGYFALCNAGVAGCDILFGNSFLQNGADAVALYQEDATSFPNGTPITTSNLIDALVYDTNDLDDAGLLVLLNPGQPQVDEGGGGDATAHSNQRCPNGSGGALNSDRYEQRSPTPGFFNGC